MGHTIWVDASAGVAGDMLAGALIDAGAPLAAVDAAVQAVLPNAVQCSVRQVERAGLRATKFDVAVVETDAPHRHLSDILALVDGAALLPRVRERIHAVFLRLGEVEARAHGIPIEAVHFHEVGAADSIADIVAVCAGLEALDVDDLRFGTIALGSGSVRTEHGLLPVPTPAALGLTHGLQVTAGGSGELATPTGLALLVALGEQAALPTMRVLASGSGAGSKDFADHPNVVRVVVGQQEAGIAILIEANVDDMDPRLWPAAIEALMAAGAQDAWLTPIVMKKGRPALTVSVLCRQRDTESLLETLLRHTSTIGARVIEVGKVALERRFEQVVVQGHPIAVKLAGRHGRVYNVSLEFEDVAAAAAALGQPQRQVLEAAQVAARESGWVEGVAL